ncbi:hypothetical protein B0T16DRAFT_463237 [Cercophora newfieldiana]|uniref:Uncharacterized protein n=1 Tax=Cercophora newfieldiana TaxID=92897 RepID=A0AA39XSS2_9PEZI|nr:hypothetical protein B0T16DRAFT_463237 [Cercophora newfieldiana]
MSNMFTTTRLLLLNGFTDDGELTAQIKRAYEVCPDLFNPILNRADRRELTQVDVEGGFEMDWQQDLHIFRD